MWAFESIRVTWCLCQSCINEMNKREIVVKGDLTTEKECEMCGEDSNNIYKVYKVEEED